MRKVFLCPICNYKHYGTNPPECCPQCKCPGTKFSETADNMEWNYITKKEISTSDDVVRLFKCPICDYKHYGASPPECCPQCKCPGTKFSETADNMEWNYITKKEKSISDDVVRLFKCPICDYKHYGTNPPECCPQCKCPGRKFSETADNMEWNYITKKEISTSDDVVRLFKCPICNYKHYGTNPPECCPQCKCPGTRFTAVRL